MTTLADLRSYSDLSQVPVDTFRELLGNYLVHRKPLDPRTTDAMKLVRRSGWLVNRIGRVLDVSGRLDPSKTTLRIDRDENRDIHVRLTDLDGNLKYTVDVLNFPNCSYALRGPGGEEIASGRKWTAVSHWFSPPKALLRPSKVVAKAARPSVPENQEASSEPEVSTPMDPGPEEVPPEV